MAISPMVPSSGLLGWSILTSTLDRQSEVFDSSSDIQADVDYLTDTLEGGMEVDDFITDRRLMRITLTAFGLADEVGKGAFVRKIVEEGAVETDAFAVKLNNTQYLNYAEAFDFTDGKLNLTETVGAIARKYKDEMFEAALGDVDGNMRLALNFQREIGDIAGRTDITETAGWFLLMGSSPLRTVVEGAFNLPTEFSQIDIDKQAEVFAEKSEQYLGDSSISALLDPENMEKVVQRFLLNEQIKSGPSSLTPGYAALTLLGGGLGTSALSSLIASF